MFTADPSTGDLSRIVIEGAFGLGEVVVGGEVEPDTYVVDRSGPRLLSVRVGRKAFEIVRGADGHDQRVDLPEPEASRRVLADDEILELARTGLRVHEHYGTPQDIEWATADGQWFILQSRPITTLGGARAGAGVRRRGRDRAADGAVGLARHGLRGRAHPRVPQGGCPAQGRRRPGGRHDQPRLGAHHQAGVGARHGRRRDDLPRRDRRSRDRRPLRRRHARGDDRAARRPGRHRRRDRRPRARGGRRARRHVAGRHRAPGGARGARGARHPGLRQPGHGRARRAGGRPARRRGGPAARRVHDLRRPRRDAPARAARARRTAGVHRLDVGVAAADHHAPSCPGR